MKGIVIDASVAASWLLDDETDKIASLVLEKMQAGTTAFVPSFWLLEINNVLFNAERLKRIDRRHRDAALDRIERLSLTILATPAQSDLKALRHYCDKHQLTSYDAEYLRLAKEQRLMLATLDRNLMAAAHRENVPVAGLD